MILTVLLPTLLTAIAMMAMTVNQVARTVKRRHDRQEILHVVATGRPAPTQAEIIEAHERALGIPDDPAEPWPLWKPEDGVREVVLPKVKGDEGYGFYADPKPAGGGHPYLHHGSAESIVMRCGATFTPANGATVERYPGGSTKIRRDDGTLAGYLDEDTGDFIPRRPYHPNRSTR